MILAEEFTNQQFEKQRITTNGNDDVYCSRQGIIEAMIVFAKVHVEAALKEAAKIDILKDDENRIYKADKESILNAYPLNLIK